MKNSVFTLERVRKVRVKNEISFELLVPSIRVYKGEFILMVGKSGCGKSTLLDMLALVLQPTEAKEFSILTIRNATPYQQSIINLQDQQLAKLRKKTIGYVLQSGGLLPYLTVKDNILLSCKLSGCRYDDTVFWSLIKSLGLEDQLSKKPQHLSGGQRQRVAIARALIKKPKIILADEPTASVDKHTALEISKTFKELTKKLKTTLLLATHDESLIIDMADRIFEFNVQRKNNNRTVSTVLVQDL